MSYSGNVPKLALSPVTIAQCTFLDAFEVAARAGFAGIGLRYDQLERYLLEGGTIEEVHETVRRLGLCFSEAGFLAEWMFHGGVPLVSRRQRSGAADETQPAMMKRLHEFLERCEAFECANVTAVPALRETGDLAVAAEEFATLCDIARPYGVRLCLEFMGNAPQWNTLRSADVLTTAAGRSNGGILIDTFFVHQGESALSDIARVSPEKIFNVQLADAKPKPRAALNMLEDRLFPGDGVAGVKEIVNALVQQGYDGWWTVEIFNPDFVHVPADEVAARAYATTRALFSSHSEDAA
jgi:2-keto-myo-inositol isomerase